MATTDLLKQAELLKIIEGQHADVRLLLSTISEGASAALDVDSDPDDPSVDPNADPCPAMNLNPHEHYDYLVVLCTTTHEWNVLTALVGLEPTVRRGKIGTSRAMRASALLALFTELAELRLAAAAAKSTATGKALAPQSKDWDSLSAAEKVARMAEASEAAE